MLYKSATAAALLAPPLLLPATAGRLLCSRRTASVAAHAAAGLNGSAQGGSPGPMTGSRDGAGAGGEPPAADAVSSVAAAPNACPGSAAACMAQVPGCACMRAAPWHRTLSSPAAWRHSDASHACSSAVVSSAQAVHARTPAQVAGVEVIPGGRNDVGSIAIGPPPVADGPPAGKQLPGPPIKRINMLLNFPVD